MPVERHIVRKRFGVLTEGSSLAVEFEDPTWRVEPYVAHTVLRARTDAWLAQQAEKAGATVVTSVPVERLNWEGNRVRGIIQDGTPMTAPVTILCDGANSRLSLGTPIRPNSALEGSATELGMKEVFRLAPEKIADRFHVRDGEGHAEEWVVGTMPPGVMGGGFLYTNQDTLSVGLIVNLASVYRHGVKSHDLMERFKLHPTIAARLDGAELVEYGAKLISSGWASRPAAFHGDGWMIAGDAAGFVFSNGLVIQGMNYAVRTGIESAETALAARAANDYSERRLAEYDARLERSHVLADFREFAGLDRVKWNPRFYGLYPKFAIALFHEMMSETGGPKQKVRSAVRTAMRKSGVSRWRLARDGFEMAFNG